MKKSILTWVASLIICVAVAIPLYVIASQFYGTASQFYGLRTQHPRPVQVIVNQPAEAFPLDTVMQSVVRIEIDGRHTGSGFIADDSGLIITARHVVDRAGEYAVIFTDGTKRKVQGIRISEKSDCAVLSVSRKDLLALKTTTDTQVTQPVFVIGSPYNIGLENYVTRGIVSKTGVYQSFFCNTPLIMIDADSNPGNSGGPVFNMAGEVIGITIGGYGRGIGISYVVSSVDFIKLLEGWRDEGENWDEKWGPEAQPEWQSKWRDDC